MAVEQPADRFGSAAARAAVDLPSAVFAAAYLIALTQIVFNIQPLLLGALAKDYGLSDRQLGYVSAVYIGTNTVVTLTAPFWIRRVNWRLFSIGALLACAAAFVWGASLHSSATFLLLFAVLGTLQGAFGAPAFASLGDSSNPDRTYGLSAVLQGVTAAAVAAPVSSFVIPRYGVSGLFLFLAALYATGLVAGRWMPRAGRGELAPGQTGAELASMVSRAAVPALIAALAAALFTGAILAFWYYVERIGAARGVPADLIGLTISVTALCSIGTSAINVWLGGRLPTLIFVSAGGLLIIAGYASLLAPGHAAFMVCTFLFSLGWGLASPAYWAIARKVDATGRLFVAAPAAAGGAGVLIGIIAGPIIERAGYAGLLSFSVALLLAAAALALGALRAKPRSPRP